MDTSTAEQTINDVAAKLGLTIKSVFIPFSQSRNKSEKDPSLNWLVTLLKNNKPILTTNYMAGCGHCPAYKASIKQLGHQNSLCRSQAIKAECETGKPSRVNSGGYVSTLYDKTIEPKLADILHSLCLDSDVINYGTFEEWANAIGYDTDSIKDKKIYKECMKIALKLRNSLGDEGLKELCESVEGY